MNSSKQTYETPAIQELGSISDLTQAQNVEGPGDALFSVLKAGSK